MTIKIDRFKYVGSGRCYHRKELNLLKIRDISVHIIWDGGDLSHAVRVGQGPRK